MKQLPGGQTRQMETDTKDYERSNFVPIRDHCRLGSSSCLWGPYNQNVLKGDFPILNEQTFLMLTGISDVLLEAKNVPTAQRVSHAGSGNVDFFGCGQGYWSTKISSHGFKPSMGLLHSDQWIGLFE